MSDLFGNLSGFGAELAVITDEGERIAYRSLAERADDAVKGLGRGRTLVAVECDNSAASLCAYLGAVRGQHAVILIDAGLSAVLKRALLLRYRVAASWSAASRSWEFLPRMGAAPVLHRDLAILLSTSGTTGSPKLVRLSLKNVEANSAAIVEYLDLAPCERPITALPMHYSYGLSVVHSHLASGATLLLTGQSITSRGFWDFFREGAATSFSGVPTMYEMLRRLRFENMQLPSLRTLTQAGGRLAPESVEFFAALAQKRGQLFWTMYGQTEATARMAYLPPEHAQTRPHSIGRPIPGGGFKLVDAAGTVIETPGIRGELIYTGPNVMMGYADCAEDLARGDELQGRLATGDLAWFDEENFYFISGRLKRFIKLFGNRVSLDEVEAFAHASGLQAAATGTDDLLLLAVIAPSRPLKEIKAELCRHYRLHHSVVRISSVRQFPMSAAGKIQYAALLENLLASPEEAHS